MGKKINNNKTFSIDINGIKMGVNIIYGKIENENNQRVFGEWVPYRREIDVYADNVNESKETLFQVIMHELGHAYTYTLGTHLSNECQSLFDIYPDAFEIAVRYYDYIKEKINNIS